ncbi:MAG: hypothetical protein ABEI98_09560 [Halorhabdus sp.]
MDTRVRRLISRFFDTDSDVDAVAWIADVIIPARRSDDFLHAMLDFAAEVCTASSPYCDRCPLRRHCEFPRSTDDDLSIRNDLPTRRITGVYPSLSALTSMREIIADTTDGTPVVRFRCPECDEVIDSKYSVLYGKKSECPGCGEMLLVRFRVESVPQ